MEPFTHALTSLAISRAVQERLPRFGTTLLVTAGVAPDLDHASYLGGAGAFLRFHRTALHSLAGAAVMSCALAALFCALAKRWPPDKSTRRSAAPMTFAWAVGLSMLGAAGHDLLDLASGEGVELWWPFKLHWSRWNLAPSLDPWILAFLTAGILIPRLFWLVGEEVGVRRKGATGSGAARVTLLLVLGYLGARAYVHRRAVDLLLSSEYHGREPLSAGAFPSSASPLDWRGVVSTDNTLEEIDVGLASEANFNADRSLTHYKPGDSPALEAGERTAAAQVFLKYAEFPLATVAHREDGYRVELRDLRFPSSDDSTANILIRVELNSSLLITDEEFRYVSAANN